MPNANTHDLITVISSPIVIGFSYYITEDIKTTSIIFICFLFASFMFNGDLDIVSRPYNRWWVFKMIWIPYQIMFEHRSVFTHGIIIGTIVRLIYVGIIPLGLIYLKNGNFDIILNYLTWNEIFFIVLGLELGSSVHTISDKIF